MPTPPQDLTDLAPLAAVEALETSTPSPEDWDSLDRVLAHHLLSLLLDGEGDGPQVGEALSRAVILARAHSDRNRSVRWSAFLDLVRLALRRPSTSRDLREAGPPSGLKASILRALFRAPGPLQPSQVADGLAKHKASVSRALPELEAAGLVVRQESPHSGKDVWVLLTPRGRRMGERFFAEEGRDREAAPSECAPPLRWWNQPAPSDLGI